MTGIFSFTDAVTNPKQNIDSANITIRQVIIFFMAITGSSL